MQTELHPLSHVLKLSSSVAHNNPNGNVQTTTGIQYYWVAAMLASLVTATFFSTFLTNLAAALISITALVYWCRYRPWHLLRTPLAICCITLLAWILLRDVTAGSGWISAWREVNDFRPLIFIVLWAPLFLDLRHRKIVAATFGICMAIFCIVVLTVTVWTGSPAYVKFYSRAPDLSGPLLVTAIMAAIQLALTQKKNLWFWWLGAILGSTVLFFASDRRTGYLIFFICVIFLVWMNSPKLNSMKWSSVLLRLTLVPSLLILVLLVSSNVRQGLIRVADEASQFTQTVNLQQGSLHTSTGLRLRFWSITKEVIQEAPWVGSGLSKFPERYAWHNSRMGGSEYVVKNPHNEYIYILAGLGVVGLLMYLAIQIQIIIQARRLTNISQRNILQLTMLALLSSIFFNSMIIDMVPGHFYALAILCLGWFDWSNPHEKLEVMR